MLNPSMQKSILIQMLMPKNSVLPFVFVMLTYYAVFPIFTSLQTINNDYIYKLVVICFISLAGVLIGQAIHVFDERVIHGRKFFLNENKMTKYGVIFFVVFTIYTILSAPTVPLVSLFQGASAEQLSIERGDFLKTREGFELALGYISAFVTNMLMPYILCLLFYRKSNARFYVLAFFTLYCFSFLHKALFITAIFPLLVLAARLNKINASKFTLILISIVSVLFVIVLATSDDTSSSRGDAGMVDYLRSDYVPSNGVDYFIWRSVFIPIVTALDTLVVLDINFNDEYLLGSTSTFISSLFGMDRINLERYVFEYQFGGWSDIGNANSVFFVDAYANFGYVGVLVISILVGLYLRWYRLTGDVALSSMWLLFSYHLFNGSFIGLMFSNGFIVHAIMFFMIKPMQSR